jgi:hypothetical protein
MQFRIYIYILFFLRGGGLNEMRLKDQKSHSHSLTHSFTHSLTHSHQPTTTAASTSECSATKSQLTSTPELLTYYLTLLVI